jgi:hypothetical protein
MQSMSASSTEGGRVCLLSNAGPATTPIVDAPLRVPAPDDGLVNHARSLEKNIPNSRFSAVKLRCADRHSLSPSDVDSSPSPWQGEGEDER